MTFGLPEALGSSNSYGSQMTIIPFENTFGSDQIGRKYPQDSPGLPDPPNQSDSKDPPNPLDLETQ